MYDKISRVAMNSRMVFRVGGGGAEQEANNGTFETKNGALSPSDRSLYFHIPMRPWERVEPDARAWAVGYYRSMSSKELRLLYGKGARGKTPQYLQNMLVKRQVAYVKEAWSRDVSAGRGVNLDAL